MTTMAQDRSPEYVHSWLGNIARKTNLSDHEVARIMERVTGQSGAYLPEGASLVMVDRDRAAEIAGAMTPDTAMAVLAAARQYSRERYPYGRCEGCGLRLNRDHECEECV